MESSTTENPQIGFTVEMGPNSSLRLKIRIRDKEIPLTISAEQAGQLGHALLAGSAICGVEPQPPEGTKIENCHFPVLRWGTGYSNSNNHPVLVAEVPGGTQLTLQFDSKTAVDCGESLARAGGR